MHKLKKFLKGKENKNDDSANDDGSKDYVINEYWDEVECDPEDFE